MVAEARVLDRMGLAEIVVEVDGVKERLPRVAGLLGRQGQNMVEPIPPAAVAH